MKKCFASAWICFLCIFLFCALLLALLLPVVKPPFGVAFACLALAALLCCIFIKKTWVTYTTMVVLPLFAVVAIMEFHLQVMRAPSSPPQEEGTYSKNIVQNHPVRGYGPMLGQGQYETRSRLGDSVLYDVVYSTNAQGWRVTPQHPQASTAVLFFGCSFTWGYGVGDQENYPYIVGELLGDEFQVYNLSFNGYGAHQLLASVESGEFDDIVNKYQRVHIFYLNIPLHEMRPAGYVEWDTHGPRYVLKDGKAVREGNLAPWWNTSPATRQAYALLKESFLFRSIFIRPAEWALKDMRVLDNMLIRQARDLLLKKHPNADFTLMVYPSAVHHIPLQKQTGLDPVDMTSFFRLPPADPQYCLPEDRHPSGMAHRDIAEGIARLIRDKQ